MSQRIVVALGPVDSDAVGDILGDEVSFVTDPTPDDLAVAEGAIVRADRHVDEDFLDRAPRLRVIARTGVGVDLVDLAAASARGIPVVVTPGSGSRAVAEGVLAMTLHLAKRLRPLTDLVREGRWNERSSVPVGDLDGATMGIVGYGRIGRRVGELAAAFGMRTLAYDPVNPPPADIACPDLGALAGASDVLTLHVPLNEDTRHLVNEELLSLVKPGAVLVNCGRGGLLDLDSALAALEVGRLSGVGLDVFDPEPARQHPLFDHPDVVLTPHLMGMTRRAMALTFADAAHGVADVLAGRPPAAVANPAQNHRKATS
ncbi:NAD(P)-dependent oxidoreductase [Nocardiopsis sp. NPDC050513]|uniref:NAD(P)-dependent oxidoreductase n=1 Tax=Nocardiopsis sp. NPDC050513 TaxID=3364338 RepID=UPI0037A0E9E5